MCYGLHRSVAIFVLALGLFCQSSQAVIINSSDGTGNTSAPSGFPYWNNIGYAGVGSAIYLGNQWVLTALHVGAGPTIFNGVTYQRVTNSNIILKNPDGSSADLIMYRITQDPGLPALPLVSASPTTSTSVYMMGYGRDRDPNKTYWDSNFNVTTPLGAYQGYNWASTRSLRWGTNSIYTTNNFVDTGSGSTWSFATRFLDSGASQAQAADGDSGGGVFVKSGTNTWQLAGMLLGITKYANQPNAAVYGNKTYAADLTQYAQQLAPIPGDADGDGTVGGSDYTIWLNHFGTAGGWQQGDFDDDGVIGGSDYAIWLNHFGMTKTSQALTGAIAGGSTVPEPGTLILLGLGGAALLMRRRRTRRSWSSTL